MYYVGKLFCQFKIIPKYNIKLVKKKKMVLTEDRHIRQSTSSFFLSFRDIFLVPFVSLAQWKMLAVLIFLRVLNMAFSPPIILGIPFTLHNI